MPLSKHKLKLQLKDMIQDSKNLRAVCLREGRKEIAEYWLGKEVAYTHVLECMVK